MYGGGSFRSSSTSISTAYRRGCVVRSSPRPCYFCATSCPCNKKLSRSSTRDRTALFIEHIVSEMTASALVRLVPTVPCCRARRHCVREPHLSHMPSGFAPPLPFCASGQVFCCRTSDPPHTHAAEKPRRRSEKPDGASPNTLRGLPHTASEPLDLVLCVVFLVAHSGSSPLLIRE